jgi:hypothetical protein
MWFRQLYIDLLFPDFAEKLVPLWSSSVNNIGVLPALGLTVIEDYVAIS